MLSHTKFIYTANQKLESLFYLSGEKGQLLRQTHIFHNTLVQNSPLSVCQKLQTHTDTHIPEVVVLHSPQAAMTYLYSSGMLSGQGVLFYITSLSTTSHILTLHL